MIRLPLYSDERRAAVERADPLERDPDCRRCPLGERESLRNRCLPADGAPGGLLVVGEGPGVDEDRSGRPFVGSSGAYLRREVAKHWKGSVVYANATGCLPPREGKDRLLPKAVVACRGFLRQVIDEVEPTRVVVLGSWAALSVLGRAVAPMSVRGGYGWLWMGGRPAPAYLLMHLAAALRNRAYARWFEEDLRRVLTQPDPPLPPWSAECRVVESEADAREAARELSRASSVWASTDCETFGRTGDPGFRVFSMATCARGSDSPWVWPLEALEDPACLAQLQAVFDSTGVVGQNFKYDRQSMRRGLELEAPAEEVDTRLVRRLIDPDAQADLETMSELVGLGGHKEENAAEVKRAKTVLMVWARQRPDGPRAAQAHETVDDLMAAAWEREAEERQSAERKQAKAEGRTVPRLRAKVEGTAPARWWTARPGWWTEEVRARLGEYRREERRRTEANPEGWILDAEGRPKFFPGVAPETYAYALVDRRVSWRYVALDSLTTARVAEGQERQMVEQPRVAKVWRTAVRPASSTIARLEEAGVLVSQEQIQAFAGVLRIKMLGVWDRLQPYQVNPDSAPQLRELLFKRLGLTPVDLTDTGLESTDRDALRALRGQHPVIEDLIEWRRLTKLLGTYADGMRAHIQADGRIHASFNIDGARSGRLSSSGPNMQNAPRTGTDEGRMFRDVFVAPPGYVLVEGDLSQIELRVAAMLSGDPEMTALFRSGADFHMQVARSVSKLVWGIPPDAVTDAHRSMIKTFVFGIIYAMSDEGIMERTGCTRREAETIRESVMGRFTVLGSWIERKIREAHRRGGVFTWWGGDPEFRFRPLPALGDGDSGKKKHAENASYNCLDAETEALTQRGWVRGFALQPGDVLLTKNADSGLLEWQPMTDLRLWPEYDGPLVEIRSRSFSSVSTPNHRWLVTNKHDLNTSCRTTSELSTHGDHRIHRTGTYAGPAAGVWSDDMVELAGWFLTDGTWTVSRPAKYKARGMTKARAVLYQSERANAPKVARIESLLARLGGSKRRWVNGDGVVRWDLLDQHAAALCAEFPGRVLTHGFLAQLSGRQAHLLMEVMMLGDGTRGQGRFTCRSAEAAGAFQSLAMLCGLATSARWEDMRGRRPRSSKMKNAPRSNGAWRVQVLKRDKVQVLRRHVRRFESKQPVWCPVVPNTYFVARRDGHVFVTGNTVIQGTANEFCLQSLVALDGWLLRTGFPARPVLTVHDSIVSEVREDRVAEYVARLDSIFTGWESGGVPIAADYKVGKAWGSCEKYKLEERAA